jgi:nucleotide-binding universal stress UspA family protein
MASEFIRWNKQKKIHGGTKMKKVLIAVDDTKGSLAVLDVFRNQVRPPEEVILVHVQKPLGKSLMGQMISDAEMATLKEMLKDTELQEELDAESKKILSYYTEQLKNDGLFKIKTVVRVGNVHEEILKVSQEEQADMLILGCSGKTSLDRLLAGNVTKDVERRSRIPVVVAKGSNLADQKVDLGDLKEVYHNVR